MTDTTDRSGYYFRPYFYRGVAYLQAWAGAGIHIQIGSVAFGIVDLNYRERRPNGERRSNNRLLIRLFPAR